MAGLTYEPIATTTLTSNAGTYTFTSISASYTDLILVGNTKSTIAGGGMLIRVGNGSIDSAANYSSTIMDSDGASLRSVRRTSASYMDIGWYANPSDLNFCYFTAYFQDYSNSSIHKTMLGRQSTIGGTFTGASIGVGHWRSASAINQISLIAASGGSWVTGSSFTLYGIKAA